MRGFLSDIRYALRTLRQSGTSTVVAVLSLAVGVGAIFPIKGVRMDKSPMPSLPADVAYRGDWEGFRFTPDGKIVFLQGQFRAMDFVLVDPKTGEKRQLTKLKPGYSIRSFDISPDGKEILFDRVQENSDIVLIELNR